MTSSFPKADGLLNFSTGTSTTGESRSSIPVSNSNIGERLGRVRAHLEGEEMFLANYADGLSISIWTAT